MVTAKAVVYARFSSDNQRDESIDAQLRAIEEYTDKNNIQIVKVFVDRAKSATSANRPEFQNMIKYCEADNTGISMVIVHKLDRFSRDKYDSAMYKQKLKLKGIRVVSVLENLDNSPESLILESVIEGMAQYYSANLAREVAKGQKENALKSLHNGGDAPLGYDVAFDKTYLINEEEAQVVKIIFDMYVNGYSYSNIIDKLNGLGYKTKRGNKFGKNSLYSILSNEKYTGVYVFNKTQRKGVNGKRNGHKQKSEDEIIKVEGGMPQIIDKEVFRQAQEMMQKRKKTPGSHKATTLYLLTGIIRCGECGHAMQGNKRKDKYGNDYISYRCGCRKQKRDCKNKEIKRDYLEEFVLTELEKHVLNDEAIPALSKELNERIKTKSNDNQEMLNNLKSKLEKVNKEIENILNAIMSGIVNNMIKDKLDELEQVKVNLEVKINELSIESNGSEAINIMEDQIRSMFGKFKEFVLTRNLPECKKFISDYVKEVIVYKDHIEVIFNVVFSFVDNEITYDLHITTSREKIK
ncbi:TPA: recombinase family protein [Clostridioides difficile]|uniref:recombinase family protein n=1 Tax=Clostridioides difficile TaxID=1496 RepID=UPI00097FE271|nr:recombinase family protein [Clostridioides difficile]AXU29188.1 site-specific recombinase, DNA invertase Pin [Clostridioides difficile]AXU32976.1 site-specific recombinase, DNA invertase Pin [Clostridioides difficile]AXU36764.1 site-specific recombinase, DNA invertase Pin [Clostridioides difficile]MCP8413118.1 recombinase family protein [Clostridioides difficile]MDC9390853.1 recombinase family protein [Clostridioides difficile]